MHRFSAEIYTKSTHTKRVETKCTSFQMCTQARERGGGAQARPSAEGACEWS